MEVTTKKKKNNDKARRQENAALSYNKGNESLDVISQQLLDHYDALFLCVPHQSLHLGLHKKVDIIIYFIFAVKNNC